MTDGQANRAGSDDQSNFPGPQLGSLDGVRADTKHFDQRQVLQGNRLRFEQLVYRNDDPFLHAAISVDAQHLHLDTTIGFAPAASNTLATVQIRDDTAGVANSNVYPLLGGTDGGDLNG